MWGMLGTEKFDGANTVVVLVNVDGIERKSFELFLQKNLALRTSKFDNMKCTIGERCTEPIARVDKGGPRNADKPLCMDVLVHSVDAGGLLPVGLLISGSLVRVQHPEPLMIVKTSAKTEVFRFLFRGTSRRPDDRKGC